MWQVVEVTALLGVAGRIPRLDINKEIAFDLSYGEAEFELPEEHGDT
jgi:hypothetical protein